MAANDKPIFLKTINNFPIAIIPADGTGMKDLAIGASDGTRINSITVCGTDTVDREIALYFHKEGIDMLLGTINIPAGAGSTSLIPGIEMISTMPHVSSPIMLKLDEKLKVAMKTVVTPDKFIHVIAFGGSYS